MGGRGTVWVRGEGWGEGQRVGWGRGLEGWGGGGGGLRRRVGGGGLEGWGAEGWGGSVGGWRVTKEGDQRGFHPFWKVVRSFLESRQQLSEDNCATG